MTSYIVTTMKDLKMINNNDEFNKTELYAIIKLLGLKPVSKATKPMLVSMINKHVEYLNTEAGIEVSDEVETPSVVDTSIGTETDIDTKEPIGGLEPDLIIVDEEIFKGFHPITGKPL